MPYKERAKSGEPRKRDKPTYQVVNGSAYNQSLRKRRMVTLYFPKGDLAAQFYNPHSYVEGASGRGQNMPRPTSSSYSCSTGFLAGACVR
ncbi:hypothetical protein [Chromobacterium amazonense]|uniref:hypothetical protein n=1 Tax=Chromobacterium amazonense TaxID=1382803 RepID=UPI003F7A83C3